MKMDVRDHLVVVTLSKRNLLALLMRVDDPLAFKLLTSGNGYRDGEAVDDLLCVVCVEPDAVHYADREAGRMLPWTEDFIARLEGTNGEAN